MVKGFSTTQEKKQKLVSELSQPEMVPEVQTIRHVDDIKIYEGRASSTTYVHPTVYPKDKGK